MAVDVATLVDSIEKPDSERWRDAGACVGTDLSVFFPMSSIGTEKAISICCTCTVQGECLYTAIKNRESAGVWGAATAIQRQDIGRNHPTLVR